MPMYPSTGSKSLSRQGVAISDYAKTGSAEDAVLFTVPAGKTWILDSLTMDHGSTSTKSRCKIKDGGGNVIHDFRNGEYPNVIFELLNSGRIIQMLEAWTITGQTAGAGVMGVSYSGREI